MAINLNYSIKLFNPVLVKLHASEPLIQELLPCTHNLLREILTKFVKPEALIGKDVTKVNFEDPNLQREDRDLGIGVAALGFIQDKDRNNLRESRLPDFYLACSFVEYWTVQVLLINRTGKDVTKVNFEDPNLQREDRDLGIGVAALGFIQDKDRNNLRESRLPDFYLAVRRFYKDISSYQLKSLPWDDPLFEGHFCGEHGYADGCLTP
ncbi:hypothetical protein EGW08_020678 [Elysia chlorotica]|uniref:Uncharacterized protein n=1 Tax=Elysia chlorotica TaxID=188477 RepID=A0A3S1ATC8_ELYCH|nr:hypothetical protein EGW08_020678 [Elysia chlorotica]